MEDLTDQQKFCVLEYMVFGKNNHLDSVFHSNSNIFADMKKKCVELNGKMKLCVDLSLFSKESIPKCVLEMNMLYMQFSPL